MNLTEQECHCKWVFKLEILFKWVCYQHIIMITTQRIIDEERERL